MQHKKRSKKTVQKELLRRSGQTEPRSGARVDGHCVLTVQGDLKRMKHFIKSVACTSDSSEPSFKQTVTVISTILEVPSVHALRPTAHVISPVV